MSVGETIFALSSGAGKAGIAVLRISGPMAREATLRLCGTLPAPRVARYGQFREPVSGEVLDSGISLWFPGPRSATGEDVAEFHVHGGRAVVEALFGVLKTLENTRLALPGEFLRRAFAAGKADLIEIEGLADLLNAETAAQRRLAMRQAGGFASGVFEGWRNSLLQLAAHVEALVDFGDEEDVARLESGQFSDRIRVLAGSMSAELERALIGRPVRQGFKVVLAGLPNTGKSSLLNALARRDVAIVSPLPGTTRDAIEAPLEIDGLLVTLTDTAGLRKVTADEIEMIGIGRSRRELERADLVVWVSAYDVDGSANISWGGSVDIAVRNKCDIQDLELRLARNEDNGTGIAVSARTGQGIDRLLNEIGRLLRSRYGQGEAALLVRERQVQAVQESIRSLNDAAGHVGGPLEVLAEDLRRAGVALARLTGRIDVEDMLAAIFSEFCIGK